jgi:N4-gp56 family major capsid protein
MPDKTIPANPNPMTAAANAGNVDLVQGNITSYQGLLDGPQSELRSKVWSELVTRDAREKNVFDKFIGGEGSDKPITEKRDLSAGGSDRVVFTTVAPIRGQGVRGEATLKNSTDSLDFNTFAVEIDLVRHAVAWTQVIKLMRFTGKTIDQLSAEVMTEWMARTEQDHIQFVMRQICLNNANSSRNLLAAYGTGAGGALKYSEGLSTDIIQEAKQALIATGGEPMNTGGDINQEIPGYLFFAPDACLRPLRSDPDYLEAITQADVRSDSNKLYTGSYAKWDNNIIANHNVIMDTARGRQGSPLLPSFSNFEDIADVTNTGVGYQAAAEAGDHMANFLGSNVKIPGGGGVDAVRETGTFYILGIDPNGAVNLYSYQHSDFSADLGKITNLQHVGLNLTAGTEKGNADHNFPAGSTFVQANSIGTPVGYALSMGRNALYYAKGSVFGEQIFHYDDYSNSGNQSHLSSVGVQSVYGMAARKDTRGRIPSVQLVEVVRQVPGLTLAN